jgi:hypothetical protein
LCKRFATWTRSIQWNDAPKVARRSGATALGKSSVFKFQEVNIGDANVARGTFTNLQHLLIGAWL